MMACSRSPATSLAVERSRKGFSNSYWHRCAWATCPHQPLASWGFHGEGRGKGGTSWHTQLSAQEGRYIFHLRKSWGKVQSKLVFFFFSKNHCYFGYAHHRKTDPDFLQGSVKEIAKSCKAEVLNLKWEVNIWLKMRSDLHRMCSIQCSPRATVTYARNYTDFSIV